MNPMAMMPGYPIPGMPGPAPGASPMPSPGGGAPPMEMLEQFAGMPSPGGEDELLGEATNQISLALTRIHLRSPRAAKLLADAQSKVQQAREVLSEDSMAPLGLPPNLLGGGMPGMGPGPGM